MLKNYLAFWNRKKAILKQAKKNKEIVYGARAMNRQTHLMYHRQTIDWDLYSNKPKRSALQIERTLDKQSGKDTYYTKEALHPGTFKVMHKGMDMRKGTKDDFGVADYTKPDKIPKTKIINGVRHVTIPSIVKDRKRSLKDKESAFRHEQDRMDLRRINANKVFNRKFRRYKK